MDDEKRMETCYLCGKRFDMNSSDKAYYRYKKFPICDYCSEFYGFYNEDI